MTNESKRFIRTVISHLTTTLREEDPALTPGEIYDEIAQELERRCQSAIGIAGGYGKNTERTGLK